MSRFDEMTEGIGPLTPVLERLKLSTEGKLSAEKLPVSCLFEAKEKSTSEGRCNGERSPVKLFAERSNPVIVVLLEHETPYQPVSQGSPTNQLVLSYHVAPPVA